MEKVGGRYSMFFLSSNCLVPLLSRIVWESTFDEMWNEMCVGRFALMRFVIMLIDGRCVVRIR